MQFIAPVACIVHDLLWFETIVLSEGDIDVRKAIRLACRVCDRQDFDGITAAQLKKAIENGWKDVERVQTYAQACKTYEKAEDEPPGFSRLDWWTHLGNCPDCPCE